MGLIYTDLLLANPSDADLLPVTAWAFVDTDAMFLCIPANTTAQLKLKEYEQREIIIADRNIKLCGYVGQILLKFCQASISYRSFTPAGMLPKLINNT